MHREDDTASLNDSVNSLNIKKKNSSTVEDGYSQVGMEQRASVMEKSPIKMFEEASQIHASPGAQTERVDHYDPFEAARSE